LREIIGINSNSLVVGFMGRLVEEKGILDLLEAISRVSGEHVLLFIGSGQLKGEILQKAKKLGLEGRVKIIDHVSSMKVPDYLSCFDVLVLPSLTKMNWKEQFGRVLIEAMACEVPVIGSSSGEIPSVIGDAGLVFQEGNVGDLVNKIELIMTDNNQRKALGKKGRKRVLDNFTHKIVAERTFRVYQYLMQQGY
jgi:glycosyltransferase involved in cell wall biosynthesis